jgi:hypothetical protein
MGFNLFQPSSWFSSGSSPAGSGAPAQNPNAYNYGGAPNGAALQESAYNAAGQKAMQGQAAQVSNAYGLADRAQNQGVQSGEQGLQSTMGGLAGYYQNQLNGTGPNLAAQQAQASTDQSIQAQQAVANSAHGSLASAGASRAAAAGAAQAQQAGAQQAVQGTIQQENQAQTGLQNLYGAQAGLYGQMGQQGLQQQGNDLQNAQYAAGLQEQQNQLNQQGGLAYAGLGQSVAQSQLAAQEAGQNYNLSAAGMNTQNNQFNAGQTQNAWGAILGGLGSAMSMGDADLKEPGPLAGAHHGLGPAGETLREESGSPGEHDPFILDVSHQTGQMRALATRPLTPSERRQVMAPHGAGPLNSPNRIHTDVHDMGLAGGSGLDPGTAGDYAQGMAAMQGAPPPGDLAMAQAGQRAGQRPMMQGGFNPMGAGEKIAHTQQPGEMSTETVNPQAPRQAAAQALMQRNPMMQTLAPASLTGADLDLAGTRDRYTAPPDQSQAGRSRWTGGDSVKGSKAGAGWRDDAPDSVKGSRDSVWTGGDPHHTAADLDLAAHHDANVSDTADRAKAQDPQTKRRYFMAPADASPEELDRLGQHFARPYADMDLGGGRRGTVPATAHFSDAPGDLSDSLAPSNIARAVDPVVDPRHNTHDKFRPDEGHRAAVVSGASTQGGEADGGGTADRLLGLGARVGNYILDPFDARGKIEGETGLGGAPPPSVARQDVGQVPPSTLARAPGQAGAVGGAPGAGTAPTAPVGGAAHAAYAPTGRPQDIDALKAAQGAEVSAQNAVSAADQQAQIIDNAAHADKARQLGEDQAQIQRQAEEHDLYLQQQTNKRDWLAKDAKEAGENYGLHPTTAQNVRYTIASFLGAVGSGLNHGMPNVAAQNIARHQDQELDRQRQVIEAKKGRVADQDSLLAQAYRRFGNMDQAMAAARQVATQKSIEELASFAGASKNQQLIAAGDQAAALLKERIAKEDLTLYRPVTVGGAGDGGDLKAETEAFHRHGAEEAGKPGGHAMTWNEWDANWKHGGGVSRAEKPGGADKVSPRLGVRLAAVEDAHNALNAVDKLEGGSWAPLGAGQEHGAGAVTRARSALLQAGVPGEEVERVLPKDYNPSDAHLTGGPAQRVKEARALLDQQKKTIESAVEMSKGQADTAEAGP